MAHGRLKTYAAVGFAAGLAASLSGLDAYWSLGLGILVPAAVLALPAFIGGAVRGALTPGSREHPAWQTTEMSGIEFEDHVAHLARKCGIPVIMTPLTGDWGVDLIVGARPNRIAVQCKRQSRPVGTSAVQEVVSGAPMQGCTHTMVVTNHGFTPAARKLAELHGCVLVGGTDLDRLGSTIRGITATDAKPA